MENKTNWIIAAVGTAFIGLLLTGQQTKEEVASNNVANLPGVIVSVENLSDSTDRRFELMQSRLDRRFDLEIREQLKLLRTEQQILRGRLNNLRDKQHTHE